MPPQGRAADGAGAPPPQPAAPQPATDPSGGAGRDPGELHGASADPGDTGILAEAASPAAGAPAALRRRVYFLSGFDPRGAPHYHRLLGEQLRRHGRRHQRELRLDRRRGGRDPLLSRWRVRALAGPDPELELCFLHWDDIARAAWPRQPLHLLASVAGFAGWYLLGGGVVRVARLCPAVALCGAYPVVLAALAGLVAGAAGWGAGAAAAGLGWPLPLAVLLGLALLLALLLAAWRLADRSGVTWLTRSIRFTHRLGQARDGALRRRVDELAVGLRHREGSQPAAEVWLVGHSSGSFVMAMLAAALRRLEDAGSASGSPSSSPSGPTGSPAAPLLGRLRLLSLGQNLANLAVYPGAAAFRADLLELARAPRLPWLDVTSRDDFLCFAGVDAYRSCGLEPPAGAGGYPALRLIDLAGRRGLGRGWRRRWRVAFQQFDLHFDYLRVAPAAGGGPVDFDLWSELLPP